MAAGRETRRRGNGGKLVAGFVVGPLDVARLGVVRVLRVGRRVEWRGGILLADVQTAVGGGFGIYRRRWLVCTAGTILRGRFHRNYGVLGVGGG